MSIMLTPLLSKLLPSHRIATSGKTGPAAAGVGGATPAPQPSAVISLSVMAAAATSGVVTASDIPQSLAQLASDQLEQLLYCVAHTVRFAGSALLPHVDALGTLVQLSYQHEKAKVRQMGGLVLRNTLLALTCKRG